MTKLTFTVENLHEVLFTTNDEMLALAWAEGRFYKCKENYIEVKKVEERPNYYKAESVKIFTK